MQRFSLSRAALAALGLTFAVGAAHAQTTSSAANPPPGRLLASNCFQCHGTNGKGPGFDTLAGKSASEIYKDLLEFRARPSEDPLMAKHALGYTDAQLRLIAQYLSTVR